MFTNGLELTFIQLYQSLYSIYFALKCLVFLCSHIKFEEIHAQTKDPLLFNTKVKLLQVYDTATTYIILYGDLFCE